MCVQGLILKILATLHLIWGQFDLSHRKNIRVSISESFRSEKKMPPWGQWRRLGLKFKLLERLSNQRGTSTIRTLRCVWVFVARLAVIVKTKTGDNNQNGWNDQNWFERNEMHHCERVLIKRLKALEQNFDCEGLSLVSVLFIAQVCELSKNSV